MKVLGIYQNGNKKTIHVSYPPESYFNNPDADRIFEGEAVKSIYVGDMDITGIKIGTEIDVFYGESISTKRGQYSPIRRIEVLD